MKKIDDLIYKYFKSNDSEKLTNIRPNRELIKEKIKENVERINSSLNLNLNSDIYIIINILLKYYLD